MYENLSSSDAERLRILTEIRQRNNDVAWMLCDYLNNNPRMITKELMAMANSGASLPEETVYLALLTVFCGLDTDNNERDKQLANDYFCEAIHKLNPDSYTENPYYRNLKIPEIQFGNWKLTYQKYEPYEAFIYQDLITESDFKEYPRIGFFDKEFHFPSVMENENEWMSIKPSELETSQAAIDIIEGKVVTFGIGLGYFTYMATLKQSVQSITVVEHDKAVIELFKRYILPQFQHREKVNIVFADAFKYAKKEMPMENFDYAFVDTWHDVSDGLNMYLKMKKIERLSSRTKFIYWVERSLLSGLRWQIFDRIIENVHSYDDAVRCLSYPSLQKFAATKLSASIQF